MKLLRDILYKTNLQEVHGSTNIAITSLTFDSRKVTKDSLFIAIKGTQSDGHQFISKAIELGAIAVVCETLPEQLNEKISYVRVADTSSALGYMAANYFDHPSDSLKL